MPDGRVVVAVSPLYFRPAEVETLLGDAQKAHAKPYRRTQNTVREE